MSELSRLHEQRCSHFRASFAAHHHRGCGGYLSPRAQAGSDRALERTAHRSCAATYHLTVVHRDRDYAQIARVIALDHRDIGRLPRIANYQRFRRFTVRSACWSVGSAVRSRLPERVAKATLHAQIRWIPADRRPYCGRDLAAQSGPGAPARSSSKLYTAWTAYQAVPTSQYSALDQINKSNVSRLEVALTYPVTGDYHVQPDCR